MKKLSNILLVLILTFSLLIRIWGITSIPPSLYWDEMDVGYQAYSILKTGKDYFGNYPGLIVQSFADYRAPTFIYTAIPFVAILGLNSLAVRLPAAFFGTLNVLLIYLLAQILFKSKKIGLLCALMVSLSPWNIQYSRMAFEATLMLSLFLAGLVTFLRGLKNSKWLIPAGFLFGLTVLTYNTAKLFVPLIYLILILIYIRKKNMNKNFWIGSGILSLILALSLYSSFFQGGGQRFSEISVFSDPQIVYQTDFLRSESTKSYSKSTEIGQETRLLDKLIYNKATYILDKISRNFLTAFSPDFLFISGDPNLRHSPARIGEFYRIEYITILFGLGFLFFNLKRGDKSSLLVLLWVILAPLPAVITRDGGTHATRLFFLFPALNLISALGIFFIWQMLPKKLNQAVLAGLGLIWVFGIIFFVNYYFGAYKIESAKYFQYGFPQAIQEALKHKDSYDYVIIDDRKDSALMSYLFETKYDPALFQSQIHSLNFNIAEFQGEKINNLIFLRPETRDWENIFGKNLIDKNYLLVVSAAQFEEETVRKVPEKLTANQQLLDVIYDSNNAAVFYVIESKKKRL